MMRLTFAIPYRKENAVFVKDVSAASYIYIYIFIYLFTKYVRKIIMDSD
jgi:hypothetical protein